MPDDMIDLGGLFVSQEAMKRQLCRLFPKCEHANEHGDGRGAYQEVIDSYRLNSPTCRYRCTCCGLEFEGSKSALVRNNDAQTMSRPIDI